MPCHFCSKSQLNVENDPGSCHSFQHRRWRQLTASQEDSWNQRDPAVYPKRQNTVSTEQADLWDLKSVSSPVCKVIWGWAIKKKAVPPTKSQWFLSDKVTPLLCLTCTEPPWGWTPIDKTEEQRKESIWVEHVFSARKLAASEAQVRWSSHPSELSVFMKGCGIRQNPGQGSTQQEIWLFAFPLSGTGKESGKAEKENHIFTLLD